MWAKLDFQSVCALCARAHTRHTRHTHSLATEAWPMMGFVPCRVNRIFPELGDLLPALRVRGTGDQDHWRVHLGACITSELVRKLSDDEAVLEPCVLSHCRVQLFVTPWTAACQAPLSMGILQTRILDCPPPGGLPNPGIRPRSPALQADSLLLEPPGKPFFGNCRFVFYVWEYVSVL